MLKRSVIGSGALHVVVIAAATMVWPHAPLDFSDEAPPSIPVDLITIAEETNVAPLVAEIRQPEFTTPQQVAVLDQSFAPVAPPPLEQIEVAPEPVEEPPPPPPEPTPAPEPPKDIVQEEPEAVAPPPRPALPRRKPTPEPPKFDVDSVLALLDKRNPRTAPADGKLADTTVRGLGAQTAMTLDLKDALLAQMRECWNVPVGAPNPEKLIVQVRVFLAQDGRLAQPPRLEPGSRAAAASDPYMRTAAEAALRAVNVCEPYRRLPRENYDTWREIVMTFDPSKMLGR